MKNIIIITQALICIICISNCSMPEKKTFDEELYGQKSPGTIPEIFEMNFNFIKNGNPVDFDFSPDYKEFIYTIRDTSINKRIIYYTQNKNGNWINPEIAYFVSNNGIGDDPKFSPDGKCISFSSKGDLWQATKDGDRWTLAEKIPEPISTDKYECTISFSKNGNIYFAANGRPEGKSKQCDIYCTRYIGIKSDSARNINNLNTGSSECSVTVSPNENYIIFTRFCKKQGRRALDLYISFRQKEDNWSIAQNLGPFINCSGTNTSPRFSNDGKYFFFKQRIWNNRLEKYEESKQYWISTKYFDDMRDFVFSPNKITE